MRSLAARVALAVALVVAVTGVGRVADVDLAVAALLLLVTVVAAGLMGPLPGAVAAVLGFLALNWYFTPPQGSLAIDRGDDVVALLVFLLAAGLIGWSVRRLDGLRRDALRRESEARLRLELTNRLMQGDVDDVLRAAADGLRDLFTLSGCRLAAGEHVAVSGDVGAEEIVRFDAPGLTLEASPARPLTVEDRALLDAMVAGLSTSVERVALEAQVREARVATAVGQQRAGFLSAVSHNLRTPLTAVKAAASALLSSWSRIDPEERRELLETIYDESERLERLVRNTLELSRIRAGGLEAHPEDVDVGDLVRLAVRRLRPLARAHRVRLDIADELGSVRLDVTMTEQILLNLLENALRFAPPGSEIVVSAAPGGPGHWELRVADHGPGVPVEARRVIFEEFSSADTRADRGGTGLGLAIVRAMTIAQGGDVCYEDTTDGGATFVCTFPAARA